MRQIKFRAWDKFKKEITNVFFLQWDLNGKIKNPHFIYMQYTGLKDKNGVEIYEGDVVSFIVNSRGDRNVGTEVKIIVDHNKGTMFMYPAVNSTTEVIGNIYENKELLNG